MPWWSIRATRPRSRKPCASTASRSPRSWSPTTIPTTPAASARWWRAIRYRYGPARESIAGVVHAVADGDEIHLPAPALTLRVLDVPGHTAGHVAYVGMDIEPGLVFCGDTLFSAGCGRLFEGTPAQLGRSLARLAALPPDTRVYCTHEYTLSNLAFARAAEPDNAERDAWAAHCEALRARGEPTLPSTIARERAINPFLRCEQPGVIEAVAAQAGSRPQDALECLAALRAWKDRF